MPTIERAQQNLLKAQEMGSGHLDWSSMAAVARMDAGLEPFREGTDDGKKKI